MNKDLFVQNLGALAPTEDDFKNFDVSESFINEHIASYYCNPRSHSRVEIVTNDEIINLLQFYDCSNLVIGVLSFCKEVIEHEDFYEIGKVEMDILVLNKITHEIEVRDHDQINHVIWSCASKSVNFLNALLTCSECLKSLLIDSSLEDNGDYMLSVIHKCTEQAGGEEYTDFYKMLIGYFD